MEIFRLTDQENATLIKALFDRIHLLEEEVDEERIEPAKVDEARCVRNPEPETLRKTP